MPVPAPPTSWCLDVSRTLKDRIARGLLELDDAVDIATQVGKGLASSEGVTHTGIVVGTVAYMSPDARLQRA